MGTIRWSHLLHIRSIGGEFCFSVHLEIHALHRLGCYRNLQYFKTFPVINSMLCTWTASELIISRYLCIKAAMYPGSLPRILLKLQYWRIYLFSLLAVFLVSLLINLEFSCCLSVNWKHWRPKTFVYNICYNTVLFKLYWSILLHFLSLFTCGIIPWNKGESIKQWKLLINFE